MTKENHITLNISSETDVLKSVVLGISDSMGKTPEIHQCYDPDSKYHVENKTYPKLKNISIELDGFLNILNKYNVEVLRPDNIHDLNQVFARDLGFVIKNRFIISNIITERSQEIPALNNIINLFSNDKVLKISRNSKIEGGDISIFKNHIFIGASNAEDFKKFKVARTNFEAVKNIQDLFPEMKVMGFELFKSDENKDDNTLHLDCCFQPVGNNLAIIAPSSFKNKSDVEYLENLFGKPNLFYLDDFEKNKMFSNVFSISTKVVVSDVRFIKLNNWLKQNNIFVEEINYSEISKMGGLFRCSTLPLKREK